MTCPLAHDGHDCRQPRACLEAAVAAFDRADQRDAELRAAQEFVIWPDSRHHDLFAATLPQADSSDGVARVTDPAREHPPVLAGSVTTNARRAA